MASPHFWHKEVGGDRVFSGAYGSTGDELDE